MTALDERPRTRTRWEWHLFEADGWAHLYPVAELVNPRLELLRPWCLLSAPFPLEHDRPSIDRRRLPAPGAGWTCPACAAHFPSDTPLPQPEPNGAA